jgi:hypothetical protein
VLCLALTLAAIFPVLSVAEYYHHNTPPQEIAANQTFEATNSSVLLAQNQGLDPETLEILKAKKSSLDQERAQIENELAGVIRVGLEQEDASTKRTKRAICKVNGDLEALTKRLAVHQQKREAFERDWDEYYVTLRDSPEVRTLKERKRAMHWDRTQIEEKLSELVRRHGQQIDQEEEIRWYQVALREIEERLVGYQKNRDAFERDWEAFYSNR